MMTEGKINEIIDAVRRTLESANHVEVNDLMPTLNAVPVDGFADCISGPVRIITIVAVYQPTLEDAEAIKSRAEYDSRNLKTLGRDVSVAPSSIRPSL